MTTKQQKVLDFLFRWAEGEIKTGMTTKKNIWDNGFNGLYNFGDALFYALHYAGYSMTYLNAAATGNTTVLANLLDKIDIPFRRYVMDNIQGGIDYETDYEL